MRPLTWATRITIVRLLLVGPFIWLLLDYGDAPDRWKRHAAFALCIVMALTDMLDGWMARRFGQFSALGRFLDPLADKLLTLSGVVLLASVPMADDMAAKATAAVLPKWMVIAAIGKDVVIVLGFGVVYFVTGRAYIAPRRLGKWCTFAEMTLILVVLLRPDFPPAIRIVPDLIVAGAGGLAVAATLDYIAAGLRFVAAHEHGPQADAPPGRTGRSGEPPPRSANG